MKKKKSVDTLRGKDKPKLVFIGGDYDHMPPLRMIEKFVKKAGFKPVIAWDYDVSVEDIHDEDMAILNRCGNAIFDVTSPSGQLMELERCHDYNIYPLIVCAIREKSEEESEQKIPDSISSMIKTMKHVVAPQTKKKYEIIGYGTFEELDEIVHSWFKPIQISRAHFGSGILTTRKFKRTKRGKKG